MINRSSIHSFEQIFALQFSQTIKFTELTVSLSNNKPPSFEFKRHFDFEEPRRIIVETYNDFYAASPPPRKYRFIYNPRISRPQQDLEATPAFDGVSRTRFIRSGNRDGSRGRASIGVHAVSSSRKIESASGHRYRVSTPRYRSLREEFITVYVVPVARNHPRGKGEGEEGDLVASPPLLRP